MTPSRLNSIFVLFALMVIISYIYYPAHYIEELKNNIIAEKEAEMLSWIEESISYLEENNIISGIREKSEQEIEDEKNMLYSREMKERANKIDELEQKIEIAIAAAKKYNLEDDANFKKNLKILQDALDVLKSEPFTDVYRYSNIELLFEIIVYSPYEISFWEVENIDLMSLSSMPYEETESYLQQNAVFKRIVDINYQDKSQLLIQSGDEDHAVMSRAFLTWGRKILTPNEWRNGCFQTMKLLKPHEAQICLLVKEYHLSGYHSKIEKFQYSFYGILGLIILWAPFFYIISEHFVRLRSLKTREVNRTYGMMLPSIWLVLGGSLYSSLSLILTLFLSFVVFFFYPATIFFLTGYLPLLIKTRKVRRLFRTGIEVECILVKTIRWRSYGATWEIFVFSYEYEGTTYVIKEKPFSNLKDRTRTRFIALVDPLRPKKAIVKQIYMKPRMVSLQDS